MGPWRVQDHWGPASKPIHDVFPSPSRVLEGAASGWITGCLVEAHGKQTLGGKLATREKATEFVGPEHNGRKAAAAR